MLQININKDENLQDACNIFISALLPHDRYNAIYYTEILQTLFRYVRLEEFSGPYYILLKILTELKDLKSRFEDFSPVLTEESLSNTLEVSIADSITNPVVGMKEILVDTILKKFSQWKLPLLLVKSTTTMVSGNSSL